MADTEIDDGIFPNFQKGILYSWLELSKLNFGSTFSLKE